MAFQQSIQWKNALNATLASGNTVAQVIIPFQGRHSFSAVESYNQDATHTLVATLALEISNDYDRRNPTQATWDPVTDAAIVAWLTTDATATPKGGKPNGSAGTGSMVIDPLRAAALRWTATWVSGTGSYKLDVDME